MGLYWEDEEPEIVEAPPALAIPASRSLAEKPHSALTTSERLQRMEDGIWERSMAIVDGIAHFAEVTPDTAVPPEDWIREIGEKGAQQRLVVAKAGWSTAKDAPVALTLATKSAAAIAVARSKEKAAPRDLHMTVNFVHAPMREYPVRKVER